MSQGHPRVAVRTGGRLSGRERPPTGLEDQLWLGAVPPATRGRSRQVAFCPLELGASACASARDFTRQILLSWGLLSLVEDTAVIVSELVTNAVRHGACGLNGAVHDHVELILWRRSGQMVCAVTDPGAGAPVLASPDTAAEAGRGLHVVQALSAAWGWTRLGAQRKAVWATLRIPGADSEPGNQRSAGSLGGVSRQPSGEPPARRSPISISVHPARCRTVPRWSDRSRCGRFWSA
jgi:anti-sigma regulatory factor (Ser/Thr protein kinase)